MRGGGSAALRQSKIRQPPMVYRMIEMSVVFEGIFPPGQSLRLPAVCRPAQV